MVTSKKVSNTTIFSFVSGLFVARFVVFDNPPEVSELSGSWYVEICQKNAAARHPNHTRHSLQEQQ